VDLTFASLIFSNPGLVERLKHHSTMPPYGQD